MTSEPQDAGSVSSARLVRLLEEAQWIRTGGREGLYVRYAPPEAGDLARRTSPVIVGQGMGSEAHGTPSIRRTVVVPLDPSAPDYAELLGDAVNVLGRIPGPSGGNTWLSRLTASPTDQFSFSKETQAPKGWIQWDEGESLISAARGVLVAGAKSARERLAYFGNKHGQFANRYLGEVMMGQTAVGSYVVRAYVPTSTEIPLKGSREALEGVHFSGVDALSSRAVSKAVVTGLSNTVEALDHFRSTASLSAFRDPELGISYEAVSAVKKLAENAEMANVNVSWDSGLAESLPSATEFNFSASQVPVLERAAHELVAPQPQREVSLEGVVHLLSREDVDGPGVVGVTTVSGAPARKLRVHLDPEDYHRALGAHDRGSIIRVAGNLEREGNLSHLYQARITAVSASSETDPARLNGPDYETGGEGRRPDGLW
ncbi:hypothetical protein AAG589_00695 [Isoptericola sp. F-RaC21]|uniref:hypothetical protein n=1 Tax=Isoptericola sp. F-RaC21 TaxID=3141452 RepID=UPI00315BB9A4